MLLLGPMLDGLVGRHGRLLQLETAAIYTVATVSGSLAAHFWSMKTERGKSAVGASKLYAQVPVAEWSAVKEMLADYQELAENLNAPAASKKSAADRAYDTIAD